MNAFLSKQMSLLLLTLAIFAPALEAQSNRSSKGAHSKVKRQAKIVKYVQGGACRVGKGTKKHPYTSLAQAQADTSWDVLIVLSSTVALDGGITLRPGTMLIGGGEDPTAIAIAPDQPTITNSSAATNGGNGVVVTGDATIKNIYFKNTWSSAVNYDEGENVCIRKVLVTGHNQGDVVVPIAGISTDLIEVAGIQGQPTKNGKTAIENVIIRNNHTGSGLIEIVVGAQRQFTAHEVEIAELTSTNSTPGVDQLIDGIGLEALGVGATLECTVKKCYVHDFLPPALASIASRGIEIFAANGGKLSGHLNNCTFDHLHNSNQFASYHILGSSFTNTSQVSPGVRSDLKLSIDNCFFSEPQENSTLQVTAVQVETTNSTSDWLAKNSTITNVFDNFISFIISDGVEKVSLIGNTSSGFESFYLAITATAGTTVPSPQRISDIIIKNNNFTGGDNFGAIGVIPNLDGGNNPWDRLTIKAENNCFHGQGTGFAGLLGSDFGTTGAGNATITAHCNSIVGYDFDILDFFANVNYFAQRNFWGQGSPCATGADCADTQICEGGVCVGPDNVLNLGTGVVDVSRPLRASINCPNTCCETIGDASQSGTRNVKLSAPSPEFKEKLEKLKERFKNTGSA